MEIAEILDFLEENGLKDIEEIKNDDNLSIIKFCYDFDQDEISAAKSYATEESDYESESEGWISEYYSPYLADIAIDNVESILEDIMEEFEVECRYKNFGTINPSEDFYQFIIAVCDEESDVDLDDVLNEYE